MNLIRRTTANLVAGAAAAAFSTWTLQECGSDYPKGIAWISGVAGFLLYHAYRAEHPRWWTVAGASVGVGISILLLPGMPLPGSSAWTMAALAGIFAIGYQFRQRGAWAGWRRAAWFRNAVVAGAWTVLTTLPIWWEALPNDPSAIRFMAARFVFIWAMSLISDRADNDDTLVRRLEAFGGVRATQFVLAGCVLLMALLQPGGPIDSAMCGLAVFLAYAIPVKMDKWTHEILVDGLMGIAAVLCFL